VIIPDAKQELVTGYKEFLEIFNTGEEFRRFGETKLNENSSRSHVLLQLTLESRQKRSPFNSTTSQLYLVDLAGSEGLDKTGTEGIRRKEGCSINKSLLSL
jgi:centromeric protein E